MMFLKNVVLHCNTHPLLPISHRHSYGRQPLLLLTMLLFLCSSRSVIPALSWLPANRPGGGEERQALRGPHGGNVSQGEVGRPRHRITEHVFVLFCYPNSAKIDGS